MFNALFRLTSYLYHFKIEKSILNIIENFFINMIFISETFRKHLLNNY